MLRRPLDLGNVLQDSGPYFTRRTHLRASDRTWNEQAAAHYVTKTVTIVQEYDLTCAVSARLLMFRVPNFIQLVIFSVKGFLGGGFRVS